MYHNHNFSSLYLLFLFSTLFYFYDMPINYSYLPYFPKWKSDNYLGDPAISNTLKNDHMQAFFFSRFLDFLNTLIIIILLQ